MGRGRGMRVSGAVAMNVDVRVGLSIVRMFMEVDMVLERTTQAPDANAKQDDTDETFRPRGQRFERKNLAQSEREETDDQHAGGMAEPPANARGPGAAPGIQGEGRDGREVVRS